MDSAPLASPSQGMLHSAWASTPPGGRAAPPPGGRAACRQVKAAILSLICSAMSTYYAQCPLENWGCRTGGICPQGKEETFCLGTTV